MNATLSLPCLVSCLPYFPAKGVPRFAIVKQCARKACIHLAMQFESTPVVGRRSLRDAVHTPCSSVPGALLVSHGPICVPSSAAVHLPARDRDVR